MTIERFEEIQTWKSAWGVPSSTFKVGPMTIERFEDIEAWRAARELRRGIYRTTGLQEET